MSSGFSVIRYYHRDTEEDENAEKNEIGNGMVLIPINFIIIFFSVPSSSSVSRW